MTDPIQELYAARVYPAMSHPLADPAVSGVAAMLAGLHVRHPSGARILEIGCASGHHLIPLAQRWPGSRLMGIDLAASSIRTARELAVAAGVKNVEFQMADLRDFADAREPFDFIIAHGFFSWVPDEVKSALFGFCRRNLAPEGIATISFNLKNGWLPRFPVIAKARAIQQAGAVDVMAALAILRTVTESDSPEMAIIDDMLAKGPEILPFDDFAPINEPWSLEQFVGAAGAAGLRWLGESDPGKNGEELRTFCSAVLCRDDASVEGRISWEALGRIFVRTGGFSGVLDPVWHEITEAVAGGVAVAELSERLPEMARQDLGARIIEGIRQSWFLPRMEAVKYDSIPPERPTLDRFRLECAGRGLPLVDAWHRPCAFPARHYEVLAQMDGTRDQATLVAIAKSHCPELDFNPWLRHLASRGLFS